MKSYQLDDHLANFYSQFPPSQQRPVIGITTNHEQIDATLRDRYYQQIVAAGGVPVLIPPVSDASVIDNTLERIDGLLLSGGADIDPRWAGEEPSEKLGNVNEVRDLPELMITRMAVNRQLPILGICRGMQTLAMALGGRVAQDILLNPDVKQPLQHDQKEERDVKTHDVEISDDSLLFQLFQTTRMQVNSFHHQAVQTTGHRFRATAFAPDGVMEAMESTERKPVIGVQWHPEWLGEEGQPLFKWLVSEADIYSRAKHLHSRVLSLDTHCDTPMFFAEDIHFDRRDPRILVDLQKMREGRLDAVTMVCYLPQPKPGETFQERVPFKVSGPKEYADLIFDKIEQIVASNKEHLALARNEAELRQNKWAGKKSIVLGIENGLALEEKVENVAYFAQRGITYITLCHNGDNDICDSARGTQTHGGLSPLGERVVQEMNRQGVMVDLSHAAESSFYDALQVSRQPIVCSHSNSRLLCDHPRNLTDDQLRALAQHGGVAHTTLYAGFLRTAGEADIYDAVRHLEHAISVMGIDHVGIGTDFDGDGGVPGFADASEAINFTKELLRRRYNEADIQKIWGENWLRVMNQVQTGK